MVNLQTLLLSLVPVVGDEPPLIFLTSPFAAAVSDDGASTQILHVAKEAEAARAQQRFAWPDCPQPEIGGE